MACICKEGEEMKREHRSFEQARKYIRKLNLKNEKEWMKYKKLGKKPEDIPSSPNVVYKNQGWIGLGDWLGTGTIAQKKLNWLPMAEARTIIRELAKKHDLTTREDWKLFVKNNKLPTGIPKHPWAVYAKIKRKYK